MNSNCLMTVSALLFATLACAGTAHAERNPTPPPSGIVIHLFGPNSVMSNVMPGLTGETAHPSQGQSTDQTSHAASDTAAAGGEASATPSADTSNDPTWHDVLHQMFVTGDPNDPNRLAPGRAAERPGNAQ